MELSVALSVGAIIAVMLSIVLVNINSVFNNKNYAMDKFNEFEEVKDSVIQICDNYLLDGYSPKIDDNGLTLLLTKNQDNIMLKINENKLLQDNQELDNYKTIQVGKFEIIENILIVEIEFTNSTTMRFVI